MADILGGRLSIEDAFSGALQKFANGVLTAENKFRQFTDNITKSNQKITNETTKTYQQVDKIAAKFIQQGNSVADSINKANDRVRQNQEKTIEGLAQKYTKLGMTIQQAYAKAQQDSAKIWNGESGQNGNGSSGNSDGIKDFAQSFLQGGIGGIIGKLGLIGAGITAGVTVLKTLNNFMEQGFDILNKMSDGLLSPEGIKNAIEESMTFETGRMKLDLFYGSKQKGLESYQNATYVAQKTYASESDTVEISAKLGQLGITPSLKQLEKLVDVAGTRPEVQTDHIGLAVKEAVEGRIAMLQMYGINNRTLKAYFNSLKKTNPGEYKDLKGALNKEGTAGNPQKYFNLLTSYIEQSPMNNYAETYAQTVKGKIERMTGIWETMKAEIMGIDVKTGTAREGGVFATIAEQVDHLKDVLEDENTANSIQKVGKAFGSAFESLGNAFSKVATPETIDKVANAIVKIGEALAKMIDHFVDSGQLDKFLDNLPSTVDKVVKNEVIDKTTKVKTGIDLELGDWFGFVKDWTKGKSDKLNNMLGINGDTIDINGGKMVNPYTQEALQKSSSFSSDYIGNLSGNILTDANASTYIDKNPNLSDDQKQQLKDVISSDDKAVYNINIQTIQANNLDEIMKSIQEAAPNRK